MMVWYFFAMWLCYENNICEVRLKVNAIAISSPDARNIIAWSAETVL